MDTARTRAKEIERELEAEGDPERQVKEKAYLKSALRHLGVRVPRVREIAKRHARSMKEASTEELVALAEALWERPIHECRMAAVEVLTFGRKRLSAEHLPMLLCMLREARTWALVDPIAIGLVGQLFEREPESTGEALDRWAKDEDFWIRRSAMLALIPGLRRGEGDFARFARYADAMLEEKEFFIRKAIGWVLRETARRRPDRVDAFIAPRTHRASGVTMREATRKLAPARRDELMQAYRDKRPAVAAR